MMLYKKDSKWKIRQLEIFSDAIWWLIQISWLVWGKQVEHIKKCKGKNIWKSNETSAVEQADLERDALIKKKLREGYFKSIAEAESSEIIMPMLAKDYNKEKNKIKWEWDVFVQPKLDWMRCLAHVSANGDVKLMSRKNVEITTMPHINEALSFIGRDRILDWELYIHGESFQENMRLIKKYRPWESEKVKFCIYDRADEDMFHFDQSFIARYWRLSDLNLDDPYLELVNTLICRSEEELKERHKLFLMRWYEWTILRHWNEWYKKNKRANQLLKYKDFKDEAYEIIDIISMDTYSDQWLIVCSTWDWRDFRVTPKMSHKEREELLVNKEDYIWKTAEVRFFEFSEDWIPRFPICVWIRLDK